MADTKLFIYTVILVTIGVVMSYSLSTYPAMYYGYGEFHFFNRSIFAAGIGLACMLLFSHLNMDKAFGKVGFFFFIVFAILSLSILVLPNSIAPTIGGAKRWIKLPVMTLSPVEFFKIGFVFFLSWSFSRRINKDDSVINQVKTLIPYIIIFGIIVAILAFYQNDFGQTILLMIVGLILLTLSGGRLRLMFSIILFAIVGALILIALKPHRMERIKSWWASFQDPILTYLPNFIVNMIRIENISEPYQIHNASYAIFNGGFFGQGIGEGVLKLGFLSDVHTDMVLAGITEETGLVGFLFCCFCFMQILYRILRIANRMEKKEHFLFCTGICLLLGLSFFINALGVVGAIPLKGIAVPFLSYGGSSLIANCMAIGLVLALSKKAKNL